MSTILLEDCYLRLRVKLSTSDVEIARPIDEDNQAFEFIPDGVGTTLDDREVVRLISEYTGTEATSIAFFQKKPFSEIGVCYYLGILLPPDATEEQLRECRSQSSGYVWSLFLLTKEFGSFKCSDVTMWFDKSEDKQLTSSFAVIQEAQLVGQVFAHGADPSPSEDFKLEFGDEAPGQDGIKLDAPVFASTPQSTVLITERSSENTIAASPSEPQPEQLSPFVFKLAAMPGTFFERHDTIYSIMVLWLRLLGAGTMIVVLLCGLQATIGFGLGSEVIEASRSDSAYYGGLLCMLSFPVLLIETAYYLPCSLWIITKFAWPTFFAHEAYESLYWKAIVYCTFSVPAYVVEGTWMAGLMLNTTAIFCVLAKLLGLRDRRIDHAESRIESMQVWFSGWESELAPEDRLINNERHGCLKRKKPRKDITVASAEAEALLVELHLTKETRHLGNVRRRAARLEELTKHPDSPEMTLVMEMMLAANSEERLLLIEALQQGVEPSERYPWPKGSEHPAESNLVRVLTKMAEVRVLDSHVTSKEWAMLDLHHNLTSDKHSSCEEKLLERTRWFGAGLEYQRNLQCDWFAVMVFKNEYLYHWDTQKQKKVRYEHEHGESCCKGIGLSCGANEEDLKNQARQDFEAVRSSREEIKRILIDLQLDVQECVPPNGKEVYLLIRAPPMVLQMAAELLNVPMKLKSQQDVDSSASEREQRVLEQVHLWEAFEHTQRYDFQDCKPCLEGPTLDDSHDPFSDYGACLAMDSSLSLKVLKQLIHQPFSKSEAKETKGFFRLETYAGFCDANPDCDPDTAKECCWRKQFVAQFSDARKERAKVGLLEFPLAQDPLNGVKVASISKVLVCDMLFARRCPEGWEAKHGALFEKLLSKEMTEINQYTRSLQSLLVSPDTADSKRKMLTRLGILTQKLKALRHRFEKTQGLQRSVSSTETQKAEDEWGEVSCGTVWCDLRMVVCQQLGIKLEISKPDFNEYSWLDREDPALQQAVDQTKDIWSGLVEYLIAEAAAHASARDTNDDISKTYASVDVERVRGEGFVLQKQALENGSLNDQLNRAFDKGHMIKWFPLHDQDKLLYFQANWAHFGHILTSLWNWQPLADVYSYFGEEIGFYFEFLQMYTMYLALPSLAGIFFVVQQLQSGSADLDYFGACWCVGLLFWCTIFQAQWAMKEKVGQEKHNMTNFDSTMQGRQDQRTPRLMWKEDRWTCCRFITSAFIFLILLLLNLGLVLGLLIGRWQLTKHTDYGWIGSGIQGVVIVLVNILLKEVVIELCEFENHKTNSVFERHLIIKSFILEATNSYTYFFVVAFIKNRSEFFGVEDWIGYCTCEEWSRSGCDWNDSSCVCLDTECMAELRSTLVSIFITNLLLGNIVEFGVPFIQSQLRQLFDDITAPDSDVESEDVSRPSVVEGMEHHTEEFSLEALRQLQKSEESENCAVLPNYIYTQRHRAPYLSHYDGYFGTFEDMNEMTIQFGFISMFSLAFPGICSLAFLNNVVEIRSDANKLTTILQRPWPQGSPGLGIWNSIFNALIFMAILTNVSLLLYTSEFGERIPEQTRIIVFILAEHVLFVVWFGLWKYFTEENPIFSLIQYRQDQLHDQRRIALHKRQELDQWISQSRQTVERLVDFEDDPEVQPGLRSSSLAATSNAAASTQM